MMAGATHVHSHDDDGRRRGHDHADERDAAPTRAPTTARPRRTPTTPRRPPTTTTRHDRRRPSTAAGTTTPRPTPRGVAAAVGSGRADRLLRRPRRHRRAAGAGRGARRVARSPTCRSSPTSPRSPPLGFRSIGDAATGFEHYINPGFIGDDRFLDPTGPSRSSTRVDGDQRTLVSAMFIAKDIAVDDPELVDYGGPLMQWHVHENLCWALDEDGKPEVVGVTDDAGNCPPRLGQRRRRATRWSTCGSPPTSAARSPPSRATAPARPATTGARADQCAHDHGAAPADEQPATVAYDPTKPIDLSGVEGVTPEQQAYAENLVAVTSCACRSGPTRPSPRPPASTRSATPSPATSTTSSGTGSTTTCGSTPTRPESLVYEPQPDGTQEARLGDVHAADVVALETCPTSAAPLMQWHVHDNLCYTDDPVAPQVARPHAAPTARAGRRSSSTTRRR